MYLDMDCSAITYDTPPSPTILSAVDRAQAALASQDGQLVDPSALGRTETYQESLQNSLLRQMDPNAASEAELREAFCRDVDAYSYEFEPTPPPSPVMSAPRPTMVTNARTVVVAPAPVRPGLRGPDKPRQCEDVPLTACAVAYDSHDCDGGWRLVIPPGELRFRWFTSYYSYRNDIDVLGVRAGCTLTAYSDSSFNGDRITIRTGMHDRWEVLADSAEFMHMDEDIESVQCVCTAQG